MPVRLSTADTGFEAAFSALVDGRRDADADVDRAVADIIADVRARGDGAVREYTARFDRLDVPALRDLRVSEDEIAAMP